MWVLQISDVHLDAEVNPPIQPPSLVALIREELSTSVRPEEPLIVAACGDMVFKGRKDDYSLARHFFQNLREELPNELQIFPCPGNHDICRGEANPFAPFNQLSHYLTEGTAESFSQRRTAYTRTVRDTDFILVNSAHHGDHTYGLIDVDQLDAELSSCKSPTKLIVTHHNLVPISPDDRSTIVNSYEVIRLALRYSVTCILHGHSHMQTILPLGGKHTALVGVAPLLFPAASNVNNQFNLLSIARGKISGAFSYRLVADLNTGGRHAGFQSSKMEIL